MPAHLRSLRRRKGCLTHKQKSSQNTSLQAYVLLQLQQMRDKLHSGTLCCLCSSARTTRCSTPAAASPCRSMLTPRPSTAAWLSRTACLSSSARLHRSEPPRSAGSGLSASVPVEVRRSPPSMSIAIDMLWRQWRTHFAGTCDGYACLLHLSYPRFGQDKLSQLKTVRAL